jgi:fluoride ion exporter CrcB/FEX
MLGVYTTFSALAWESLRLFEMGSYGRAAFDLFGTVFIGMLAVLLGAWIGRAI